MPCRKLTFSSVTEPSAQEFFRHLVGRSEPGGAETIEDNVRDIIKNVRAKGDDALAEYTRAFDCPDLEGALAIPEHTLQEAVGALTTAELDIITAAAANIRDFHQAQKENSWFITKPDGTILGQKVSPVDRAGLYVPGGKGGDTPLLSSLLMGAIPAQVAGVEEIAVISPPRKDGTLNPVLLATAYLLEITEVYRTGGPWGIAALAYGTTSIRPVDVIAGPGNIHVTTAKKLVQGQVGIDMLAGPSEILVLADDSAMPDWIAADMLAQAEHDALASAICVTDSPHLADRVLACLEQRVQELPRADMARAALEQWSAIILVPNLDMGLEIANAIAPEHLEVCTRNPWNMMPRIRHAGAVFLGHSSPEAVGDYFAGPNHVLPTLGTARYASALSVQTFCKKTSIISASAAFSAEHAKAIAHLARMEGLEGHARSAELRGKPTL